MNNEARLKEKLRSIEALFAGAATPGECEVATPADHDAHRETKLDATIEWHLMRAWSYRLMPSR